jgi:hypothetical protein
MDERKQRFGSEKGLEHDSVRDTHSCIHGVTVLRRVMDDESYDRARASSIASTRESDERKTTDAVDVSASPSSTSRFERRDGICKLQRCILAFARVSAKTRKKAGTTPLVSPETVATGHALIAS